MNTTLQVRVDVKTKNAARKIFEEMGIDISSGVKMFLKQVIHTKSIPFQIRTENGFTAEYEKAILRESQQAIKSGKRYRSARALLDDLK